VAETPSPDTKSPVFTGDNIVEFDDPEAVQAEADRATGQDARLNDYLGARLDECVRYRDGELMDHLRECWELYDAQPQYGRKDSPWDNASNLTVALAATYVDQFTAKHVNALRSPTPFLSLKSYLPENMEGVRALSDYINWAEQSMWKGQQLVEDFERERCKVGTGVGYVGFLDIPYRQRPDITSPAQDQGRLKPPMPNGSRARISSSLLVTMTRIKPRSSVTGAGSPKPGSSASPSSSRSTWIGMP